MRWHIVPKELNELEKKSLYVTHEYDQDEHKLLYLV